MAKPAIYYTLMLSLALTYTGFTYGQTLLTPDSAKTEVYQLTGLVLVQNSDKPVPYSHVRIKGTQKGTVSNVEGFFSLVVRGGDSLKITSIGFRDLLLPIPTDLEGYLQTITVGLAPDTILLAESVVYPWPSKEAFKEAFMALETEEENQIAPYAGFKRIDNPVEPEPSVLNPISFFYENVIKKVREKKRKKKVSKTLPKWE